MSHPITNATAVRGIPSQGYNADAALSLRLTSDQMEAMFTKLMPINNVTSKSAAQFPAEIDFRNGKIYIGNATFSSFTLGEEAGVCKISKRTSPSTSLKTPTGSSLSAPIIGKLTIHRGLDDAVSNLGKATEAANVKKNERGIIKIDAPIAIGRDGKKSKTPRPVNSPAVNTPSEPPRSSSYPLASAALPSTFDLTQDLDFTSLRSRLLHSIATVARPKEVAISDFMNTSRAAAAYNDTEAHVRKMFDQVAEEIPGPKSINRSDWKWDLKRDSWLEIRPFEFPGYTSAERTQASRRARIYSRISPQNPVWEHFSTKVDSAALDSAKAMTSGGFGGEGDGKEKIKKAATTKSLMPKRKAAGKPKLADEREPPSKGRRPTKGPETKRKLVDLESEPPSDLEDGEIPSKKGSKRRRIIDSPEVSKHDTVIQKDPVNLSTLGESSRGSKVTAAVSVHRNGSKAYKRSVEKEKDNGKGKGKERVMDKENGREREKREMDKDESNYEEERPSFNCSPIDDTKERVDLIKANKGAARVKRKRRATPSFTSDDEKDEPPRRAVIPTSIPIITNATSSRTTTITSTTTTPSVNATAPKTNVTKEHELVSDPDSLPNDKASLQYAYGRTYAHYLLIISKFYTEKSKVEAASALNNDFGNIEEAADLMDVKTLSELCEELRWTKQELERLRRAHAALDANAL